MNPASHKTSFLARFWAGLLIASQLAWGLPVHAAGTLRPGQEAETTAAGLEQAVKAGLEESAVSENSTAEQIKQGLERMKQVLRKEISENQWRWFFEERLGLDRAEKVKFDGAFKRSSAGLVLLPERALIKGAGADRWIHLHFRDNGMLFRLVLSEEEKILGVTDPMAEMKEPIGKKTDLEGGRYGDINRGSGFLSLRGEISNWQIGQINRAAEQTIQPYRETLKRRTTRNNPYYRYALAEGHPQPNGKGIGLYQRVDAHPRFPLPHVMTTPEGIDIKFLRVDSDPAAAGVEETILLIGADPDGQIESILRDVFPTADIQPRKLPLPSKVQFRGIDIAVLAEFDEAAKEELVQAFRSGTISHVIAPDHVEDKLETYPLREALEGFRDTLAGMEENWPKKMKEILRPVWGERSDRLTLEDLRTLRFAGTSDALAKLLDAYGAALGFENLPPGYFYTTAMRLFAEGWLYPEPMQQPSPELFIAYAERMPSSIGNEFYRAIQAPTTEAFREKIARAQQTIEDYLRNAPKDDFWRFRLNSLVESDYTDREKKLLLQTAQRIVAALFPSEAAAERDARARDWVAKTRPPHLKEVLSQLEQLGVPFSPEVNGSYKRSFMALTSFIIRYPTFANSGGAERITVSRSPSGNEPVFVGNAAHEFIHRGISQLPELVGRAESLQISREDWFTASTESIMTRWVAEETQTPLLYTAATAIGPALVEWLHRRGTEIARNPTEQWVPQISELMRHLPPGLVPYAVGRAIGGISEQLSREAAAAAPTLNRHEAALSFILGTWIREGQGLFDLKNLGPAARKFRAAHNLPEEFSAGLEEPTDEAIEEVIEILWSEINPARRAQAEKRLRAWLIIPLGQPPAPPKPISSQDASRISAKSILDEMERTEERRSSALHAFARMLSKIQSANQDPVLGRPEILPVIRDWFRMESEVRVRIKERLDELVQTLYEEIDKLWGEQPNSRRKKTARLNRPLVRQLNVYQEEQADELKAILTQVKDKTNETMNRSTQREEQVSRLLKSSWERVKRGDPLLRELPFIGMNKKSGLEEGVLREQWNRMRSAAEGSAAVVIGPSVAERFGGLEELARLDEERRIFIDRGADTVIRLMEAGMEEARYYGGSEEAGRFETMARGLVSLSKHLPQEGSFLVQLHNTLALAGVPEPIIQAGLEELVRDLEAVAEAA